MNLECVMSVGGVSVCVVSAVIVGMIIRIVIVSVMHCVKKMDARVGIRCVANVVIVHSVLSIMARKKDTANRVWMLPV